MAQPRPSIGPYRLVRKLGEGGMGEVFEAVHETIERQVAIKILRTAYARDTKLHARMVNEARAVNLIKHPGLVQISDVGELEDGSPYIVMEYLRGETLGQRLRRQPAPLPLSQVLHTVWQVASALVAAHQAGIVHRDLKPDNIMLVADPIAPTGERAKLLDFGIARFLADSASGPSTTKGRVLGTPTYMSPEQCRGVGVIGAASDVYSLGVMLYQLIAGRPPFVSEGLGELLSLHMSAKPPSIVELAPQTPAALVALIEDMLEKDPEQRPSMSQVVAELEGQHAAQGAQGRLHRPEEGAAALSDVLALGAGQLSKSLADLLGSEIEPEASQTSAPDAAPPPRQPESIDQPAAAAPRSDASAAAESDPRRPATADVIRRSWLPAAAVCGGAVALAVAAWLRLHPTGPHPNAGSAVAGSGMTAPTARPVDRVPAATDEKVTWRLDTLPSGAHVVRADTGQDLGITPWQCEQTKRDGALVVRLQRAGYADKELQLDYDRSSAHREALTPLARPLPAAAARAGSRARSAAPLRSTSPTEKAPDVATKPVFEVID